LFLAWVNRCMAKNQVVSGSLVASKIVSHMTVVCSRHAEHCQYVSPSRSKAQWRVSPQSRQTIDPARISLYAA
jgi:hypothetical protein